MNRQLTFLLWDDDSFNWRWSVGYFDLYRRRSRCKKKRDQCLLIRLLPLISLGRSLIYKIMRFLMQLKLFGTVPRIFKNRRLKSECIDTTASDNYQLTRHSLVIPFKFSFRRMASFCRGLRMKIVLIRYCLFFVTNQK